MKVTLEFTLPEDQVELDYAQKGVDYASAVSEFRQRLRNHVKYSDTLVTADVVQEWFFECFGNLLED